MVLKTRDSLWGPKPACWTSVIVLARSNLHSLVDLSEALSVVLQIAKMHYHNGSRTVQVALVGLYSQNPSVR